jgi:hypothetical protein
MGKYDVLQNLMQTPLGRADGEANLQVPFNQGPTTVVVRVRNHSRTATRKLLKAAVSYAGNSAYEPEVLEKYKGQSPESIQKTAMTRDMNVYATGTKAVKARLPFDGKDYIIPPAKSESEEPQAVIVPEGMWDLYMGNWNRMNGTQQEKTEELNRLASRFAGRENPAMKFDRNGNVQSGYLEFIREEVRPSSMSLDADSLSASDIDEV